MSFLAQANPSLCLLSSGLICFSICLEFFSHESISVQDGPGRPVLVPLALATVPFTCTEDACVGTELSRYPVVKSEG